MVNEVFLLWHAYVTKEILLIGSLKKENNKYVFEYDKAAIKAMNLGCFLPFPYTENKLYFETLPSFFAQRMLTGQYNINKFKINSSDELALLTYYDGIKNSDNFSVVNLNTYNNIKNIENDNAIERKNTLYK